MKQNSVGKYVVFACIGLIILAAGIMMLRLTEDAGGVMKVLPYICIGVGCGLFGGNTGTAVKNGLLRKNPQATRAVEIETKDERNIALRNAAKAKAYDLMVLVFGALMLAFALMQANLYIILSFVAAYIFIIAVNVYYLVKLSKEM